MSRHSSTHPDAPFTLQRNAAGQVTGLGVRLQSLPRPTQGYHATWCAFEASEDAVSLCFGQHLGRRLHSRLDVFMGHDEFESFLESSEAFISKAFAEHADQQIAWDVDATATEKYLAESAGIVSMAYTGQMAELEFYRFSQRDAYNLVHSVSGARRDQLPVGVVSVTLSTRLVCWLLRQMVGFREVARMPRGVLGTGGLR